MSADGRQGPVLHADLRPCSRTHDKNFETPGLLDTEEVALAVWAIGRFQKITFADALAESNLGIDSSVRPVSLKTSSPSLVNRRGGPACPARMTYCSMNRQSRRLPLNPSVGEHGHIAYIF